MNSFINRADLQSHTSNVHAEKKIKCKHCEHRTVTKAKMQLHVCIHTTGNKCAKCGRKYPTKQALHRHSELHKALTEFECSTCKKVFAVASSLNVHIKGKHSYGYVCPCGKHFETPSQYFRHSCKCHL